jgi:hypothetical protein
MDTGINGIGAIFCVVNGFSIDDGSCRLTNCFVSISISEIFLFLFRKEGGLGVLCTSSG